MGRGQSGRYIERVTPVCRGQQLRAEPVRKRVRLERPASPATGHRPVHPVGIPPLALSGVDLPHPHVVGDLHRDHLSPAPSPEAHTHQGANKAVPGPAGTDTPPPRTHGRAHTCPAPSLEPRARTRRSRRHTGTTSPECTIRLPPTNPDYPPLHPAASLPHLSPMRPPKRLTGHHFDMKVQVRSVYRMMGSVSSKRLAAGSSPAGGANLWSALPGHRRRSGTRFAQPRCSWLCAPGKARKGRAGGIPPKPGKKAGHGPATMARNCERSATGSSPMGHPKHGWFPLLKSHGPAVVASGEPVPDQRRAVGGLLGANPRWVTGELVRAARQHACPRGGRNDRRRSGRSSRRLTEEGELRAPPVPCSLWTGS